MKLWNEILSDEEGEPFENGGSWDEYVPSSAESGDESFSDNKPVTKKSNNIYRNQTRIIPTKKIVRLVQVQMENQNHSPNRKSIPCNTIILLKQLNLLLGDPKTTMDKRLKKILQLVMLFGNQ
ncbi:hypothetical protein QE152_g25349 [Popillia japonica]|uniref:Uncharacterized protein n=1 Tax=Popillia japonica TaxID=7064 RepID=A0AAW1K1W1_POPJA